MYIKYQNNQIVKYPYTLGDLYKDNPHTSYPRDLTEDTLCEYGVYTVEHSTYPIYDVFSEMVQEGDPVFNPETQTFKQVFNIIPISTERYAQVVKNKILELEEQITSRRIREALLGSDKGWLTNQDILIAELRNKLR